MQSPIRVFIVDDYPIVREGLRRVLSAGEGVVVSGEASSGEELLDRLPTSDSDVVLLDVSLPGSGFLETMRRLRGQECPVLAIGEPGDQMALRSLKAGAAGYLTKDRPIEELRGAIDRVRTGHRYVSETLAERLADEFTDTGNGPAHERLSQREFQVVQLLGRGMTIGEISRDLSLSPKTVSTYRTRILRKLGLRTTADIVRYAVEKDLAS